MSLLSLKRASYLVAKLTNIPEIHRVSHLALNDFNAQGPLAQTYSEVP